MRRVYVLLALLMFAATLVQFYLAAVGAFDRPRDDESFMLHRMTGMMIIPALSVLATIVAAIVRAPGKLIALTILPVGLILVQMLIRAIAGAFDGDNDETTTVGLVIFGLHAINGLATMAVTRVILMKAKAHLAQGTGAAAPATAADSAAV